MDRTSCCGRCTFMTQGGQPAALCFFKLSPDLAHSHDVLNSCRTNLFILVSKAVDSTNDSSPAPPTFFIRFLSI